MATTQTSHRQVKTSTVKCATRSSMDLYLTTYT